MTQEVLEYADKLVSELEELLSQAEKKFPKTYVSYALLRDGLTVYKGITVRLDSVSHKYLYDYYDFNFLNTYTVLFKKIHEEKHSRLSEFAFRTILEMGVEESYILFDKNVDEADKKIYTLLKTLVDYFSIETSMREYFSGWYKKLFAENSKALKSYLTEQDFEILNNIFTALGKPLDEAFTKALIEGRRLSNTVKAMILNKYKQKGIFVLSEGYKRIKSGEAHTLHGNIFLILNRLEQQKNTNHLFRIYAYLTMSGNDMVRRLSSYLKDSDYNREVANYFTKFDEFKIKFNNAWVSQK